MRLGYFLIGLLLGIWFTSVNAHRILDAWDKYYEADIMARTLTGFYEGWDRGRAQSDRMWKGVVAHYLLELERVQQ